MPAGKLLNKIMDVKPDTSIIVYGTDFYVLKNGEQFKFGGKKYKKINEDFAILISSKQKVNFWPQQGVKFIKQMNKKEYYERHPSLEYYR